MTVFWGWVRSALHLFCCWAYNADCSRRWCRKCGRPQHMFEDNFGNRGWYDTHKPETP